MGRFARGLKTRRHCWLPLTKHCLQLLEAITDALEMESAFVAPLALLGRCRVTRYGSLLGPALTIPTPFFKLRRVPPTLVVPKTLVVPLVVAFPVTLFRLRVYFPPRKHLFALLPRETHPTFAPLSVLVCLALAGIRQGLRGNFYSPERGVRETLKALLADSPYDLVRSTRWMALLERTSPFLPESWETLSLGPLVERSALRWCTLPLVRRKMALSPPLQMATPTQAFTVKKERSRGAPLRKGVYVVRTKGKTREKRNPPTPPPFVGDGRCGLGHG